ncbi:COX15/CtaA family protein, partial [Pelagibacteraceae bacterium]|nr:COX15/CtaA family protein [Pelagibacteraceae bacterium]
FKLPEILFFFILLQISFGALVSGLNAAQIYQTWPLMGQNYFPDDSQLLDLLSLQSFENPSIVQFIHRNLAYLILFIFSLTAFLVLKNKDYFYLRKNVILIFFALFFQIFLGILTILSGAQIILASMHQIGSIFLITTAIMLTYKNFN